MGIAAFAAAGEGRAHPASFDIDAVGWFLRYSMGLSAWKAYGDTRWALRVNPSSGNLHPTEAYVVHDGHIFHYRPREHAVEERAIVASDVWQRFLGGQGMLVALTSIHWRESWKYGERAFRYCQHDIGHAIGALRVAASLFGWRLRLLPEWSDDQLAGLVGVDRDQDRAGGAEREHPECIALVSHDAELSVGDPRLLVDGAASAEWRGRANVLSQGHVDWPVIDGVAAATRYPGLPATTARVSSLAAAPLYTPTIILQRRSAVAFDGRSALGRDDFVAMLQKLLPGSPPFDAIDWQPHVHLVLFVHRVDGLPAGVYAYLRDLVVLEEWRASIRPEFLWEPMSADGRLFLLLPSDVTWPAMRISCDQDIAGAGFFSLGMIARLASSLRERGEWFYRRLFWECGMIGQVLYLEAERAGARGTGIGCFYDDPVHEILQFQGAEWQSLYHFAMGMAVDDARLTSEAGYSWDRSL